jgi:hypothetical protein
MYQACDIVVGVERKASVADMYDEATKEPRTKEPRNQGTAKTRRTPRKPIQHREATKEPRNQGTKEPRNQATVKNRRTPGKPIQHRRHAESKDAPRSLLFDLCSLMFALALSFVHLSLDFPADFTRIQYPEDNLSENP